MHFLVRLTAGHRPGRTLREVVVDAFPEKVDTRSLLAGIDPYSVTIFNEIQMRVVTSELSRIVPTSEQERSSLEAVRELAEEGSMKPHHFLWFFGD